MEFNDELDISINVKEVQDIIYHASNEELLLNKLLNVYINGEQITYIITDIGQIGNNYLNLQYNLLKENIDSITVDTKVSEYELMMIKAVYPPENPIIDIYISNKLIIVYKYTPLEIVLTPLDRYKRIEAARVMRGGLPS
jgi:hypothetical protein